ncbi:MAG: N-6 DNA methylase [Myxococcales bacterium]|nr:N-6 DNA methylase [Myxococcales bacterium]MCB9644625.1 N-6 DNA methylase [Myxococcales bacterium]
MDEETYKKQTSFAYRRALGQFFTPPWVATLMARWLIQDQPKTILDPAFGLGVFYQAIQSIDPTGSWEMMAYDVDAHLLQQTQPCSRLTMVCADYLEMPPKKYDAILCNPPYMRFQRFAKRRQLLPKIEKMVGKKIKGYVNLSSLFLLKSLHELNKGGRLAFLMPFEFFNTGYGEEIKQALLERSLLKQIVIFSDEKSLFPEVTTTVCLLLCHDNQRPQPIKVTFLQHQEMLEDIDDIESYYQAFIEAEKLPPKKKWTPLLRALFTGPSRLDGGVPLSSYGAVRRGLATGANSFFTFSKEYAGQRGLPLKHLRSCLTKSTYVKHAIFDQTALQALSDSKRAAFCLEVVDSEETATAKYLQEGVRKHYHERYLCKMRHPWYKLERREPAPLLFGAFHRGRPKVIRNRTDALHLTCFHSFYPKDDFFVFVDRLFLFFLSELGQESLKKSHRHYGNGLYKFEPNDVMETLCPSPEKLLLIKSEKVQEILLLLQHDEEAARLACSRLMEQLFLEGI